MEVQRKAFFATPQEAEAAFYEARARGDIESMMAVWGDEDDIVCALAGCPRACGYDEVRDAWRRVFAGTRVDVRVQNAKVMQGVLQSVHSLNEECNAAGDRSPRPMLIVTNVFLRGPLGWHMVLHHASVAPVAHEAPDAPKVLH
ncbi:MAG TPA: nuclear transport factor 2 family protein [Methyloversatilis sp.]